MAATIACNTYRSIHFANGCFELEINGSLIHVCTDHVGHRLKQKEKKCIKKNVKFSVATNEEDDT